MKGYLMAESLFWLRKNNIHNESPAAAGDFHILSEENKDLDLTIQTIKPTARRMR